MRKAILAIGVALAMGAAAFVWSGGLPVQPAMSLELKTNFTEPWMARASQRLAERALATDGRFSLVAATQANGNLRLDIYRIPEAVVVVASARRSHGRWRELGRASSPSVKESYDLVLPQVAEVLGGHRARPSTTPAELALARRLGTDDVENLRQLDAFIDTYWLTETSDLDGSEAIARELMRRAPSWPMSYVARAVSRGWQSPKAIEVATEGLKHCSAPSFGCALLRHLTHPAAEDGAIRLEEELSDPGLSREELAFGALFTNLATSVTSVDRHELRQWQRMPELRYGSRVIARADSADVDGILVRWEAAAPEAPQRVITAARILSAAGKRAEALALLNQALVVHGRVFALRLAASDTFVTVPDFVQARAMLSDFLSSNSHFERAMALARLGTLAVFEGQYRRAQELLQRALAEGVQYGVDFSPAASFETLRQVARVTGDAEVAASADEGFREFCERTGANATVELIDYERAAVKEKCPDLTPFLARMKGTEDQRGASRLLEQKAAARGCLPCSRVVAQGIEPELRYFDASLLELAQCAEREGKLDDAVRVLQTSAVADWGTSPHHRVLARFLRASHLEKLKRLDEARSGYEDFLHFWTNADHPVPEIALAKAAVERLKR